MAPPAGAGPAPPRGLADLSAASRRLGADPSLVLHGGGNTSLKSSGTLPGGVPVEILWIKGSGHDLATIDEAGFVPLDLARLRPLASLAAGAVDDATLMATLGAASLRPGGPFPSVESLLHAFLPAPCIVHTHADDVLILGHQPDGIERLGAALGPRFAILPYVKPGHGLARAALDALRGRGGEALLEGLDGLAFRHHGIFTWGATPDEATERMLAAVRACRAAVTGSAAAAPRRQGTGHGPHEVNDEAARSRTRAIAIAPALRGLLTAPGEAGAPARRVVLAWRSTPDLRALLARPGAAELAQRGSLTPDHLIRTKDRPLVVPHDAPAESLRAALDAYRDAYGAYLARHEPASTPAGADLDPRVIVVEGTGLFAAGATPAEAAIAADIAERTLAAQRAAEDLGRFTPMDERDVFETEYWPPEREKLARLVRPPLAGRVALVTGAAGAIGAGVARALAVRGALVLMADRPGAEHEERLRRAAAKVGEGLPQAAVTTLAFDVTDPADVARAFGEAALIGGGPDLLVLSHGAALVGDIAALDPARVAGLFGINALGAFAVLGAFVRGIEAQRTGGDVVLVSTKNVPEPGASFAAYSASKAAAHQLARVAAIELAPLDVRVNMVSPDAVFGDADTPSLLWQDVGAERARSRGIDPATLPEQYRQRNLLKARVTAEHVAEAVLFFAERRTPTTGAVLPVDGGLPGAFPR